MAIAVTRVSASASTVTLLAGTDQRRQMLPKIVNDSTATLTLKYGANCSATDFTWILDPGERWVMDSVYGHPEYDGIITGYWSSAAGGAQVTSA